MKNKLYLTIILASVIIGFFIFLGLSRQSITGNVVESLEPRELLELSEDDFIGDKFVTKIIDGDTVVVEGEHVRLLGIDSDERNIMGIFNEKDIILFNGTEDFINWALK